MFTLGREFAIGVNSKHSRKFHFDHFTGFIQGVKNSLEQNKEWNLNNLEEFLIRLGFYAKR